MAQITLPYDPLIGPRIELEVSYPLSLASVLHAARQFVPVWFLIDTGSRRMYISMAAATGLFVGPMGKTNTATHQNVPVHTFLGDLRLPLPIGRTFPSLMFLEFGNPTQHYAGVVGREVLDKGILEIDGPNRMIKIDM